MRYYLICNPGSSSGRSRRRGQVYRDMLTERGVEFDFATTDSLADAERLARGAAAAGRYDAVVAVGGDGTINRVLNGLLAGGDRGRCAMGVLYSGTSPDFCTFHGLPVEPETAVEALLTGRARPVDVCRMRHLGPDGRMCVSHFASSANLGLGAGVARRANRYRTVLGDRMGTMLAAVLTVAATRPRAMDLTIDGEPSRVDRVMNVTVGKNPYLASGLKLDVDVARDDGRLFVFIAAGIGRLAFLTSLPKVYSGRIVDDDRFELRWARSVSVRPVGTPVEAEMDGDPAGMCPVEIDVLGGAIDLIGGRT